MRVSLLCLDRKVIESFQYLFLNEDEVEVASGLKEMQVGMHGYVSNHYSTVKFRPNQLLNSIIIFLKTFL